MDWQAIGATGEILGAIGVIASLVYLASQIRQNTRSNRSNRLNEIAREFGERHMVVAANSELTRVVAMCRHPRLSGGGDISAEDKERILAWVNSLANTYLSVEIAHRNGEMEDDLYEAYCQDVHRTIETWPGTLPEWNQVCDYYPLLREYRIFQPLLSARDEV